MPQGICDGGTWDQLREPDVSRQPLGTNCPNTDGRGLSFEKLSANCMVLQSFVHYTW